MPIFCKKNSKTSAKLQIFFLLIIISIGGLSTVKGQSIKQIKRQINYRNLAHVKDKEQFGIGGGRVDNGFNVNAFYAKYWKKDILFRTDMNYEAVTYSLTKMNWWYLSPEVNYTIQKVSNQFYINAKAGLIIGSENLSNKIMVNKKLNKITLGEKIGVKFEYYITPEVSLNLDFEQRFIQNSNIGTLSRIALFSISYNF